MSSVLQTISAWAMAPALCLLLIATAGGPAAAHKVELLGQPCRAKNILGGTTVTDRRDGRPRFVVVDTNEVAHAQLVFVDFERDTAVVYPAPAGAGSWAVLEAPGDRLVIPTFYDGKFMVFDLKAMKFVKEVALPGESYVWNLALGGDGRVYGGSYPGGKLGALNLETYAVEDCGAPAPPNHYLRMVSALPDGRILCSLGYDAATTRLYNPATRKFEEVPPQLKGVDVGVSWNGYFLAGAGVWAGPALDRVATPPFPTPPAENGQWMVDAALTTPEAVTLRQGRAIYRYAKGEAGVKLIADLDLKGGRALAVAPTGEALGVRGQDYFVLRAGADAATLRPLPYEAGPRPTLFLRVDDRGRLWGGPYFGQTLFSLDAASGQVVNTGAVSDGGGEVYDVAFHDGKVYAVSYSAGEIIVYDPDQPWDQWNGKNPRLLAQVGPAYVRPQCVVPGADGKLYSSWMAQYGVYGGAVAITDPETGATELIENPLGEQAVRGIAAAGGFAYVGTGLQANGLPDKPNDTAKFGVIDLATRQPVFVHAFKSASYVTACSYDARTKRVAMMVDGRLRVFDTVTRRFARGFGGAPWVDTPHIATPGNGMAYYAHHEGVIAINLRTAEFTRIATVQNSVGAVCAAADGTVYFSAGVNVFRAKP